MTDQLLDRPSENAVVVAIDHGLSLGSVDGFRDPKTTIETILEAEPDGLLVGPHLARQYHDTLSKGSQELVVTADAVTFSTRPGADDDEVIWEPTFDIEALLELDLAGIKVVLVFGTEETETLRRNLACVARLADRLRGTSVPLIVEPVMWGPRIPVTEEQGPEYVASGARMAWEYGADILKISYTGDEASFRPIVENAPVPAMMLGGSASKPTKQVLEEVEGAIRSGARGVMIGRAVWKSEDPGRTTEALKRIVNDGATAADVWGDDV